MWKPSFYDDDPMGYNTMAEIPGVDPKLKDQVVMLGGHLDSWHASEGATDNGAGAVVAMEVVRLLKKLGVQPRRTIRIALWSGEEQGMFGSRGLREGAFRIAPLNRPIRTTRFCQSWMRPTQGSAAVEAGAEADFRLLQPRQRSGQDSGRVSSRRTPPCAPSSRSGWSPSAIWA